MGCGEVSSRTTLGVWECRRRPRKKRCLTTDGMYRSSNAAKKEETRPIQVGYYFPVCYQSVSSLQAAVIPILKVSEDFYAGCRGQVQEMCLVCRRVLGYVWSDSTWDLNNREATKW